MPLSTDEDFQQQFADLNVEVAIDEDRTGDLEIWDVNWKSWVTFLDCSSRWRWLAGLGGAERIGLDLGEIDILLKRRRLRGRVFNDLLVMEEAAMKAFGEAQP